MRSESATTTFSLLLCWYLLMKIREKETTMKTRRALIVAALAGMFVFTTAEAAKAQDLLSSLLSGLMSGSPYGGLSGGAPYDPYGSAPYGGVYRGNAPYDPYANSPSYDPYQLGRGGYYEPSRGSSDPYPDDYYRDRDNRYRYQDRLGQLNGKYDKAMRRLGRQESEARAKAYRKSNGDPNRYRDQLAEIDRKYERKRYQVQRNTANDHRELSRQYGGW
jgi:hypothetical protein